MRCTRQDTACAAGPRALRLFEQQRSNQSLPVVQVHHIAQRIADETLFTAAWSSG